MQKLLAGVIDTKALVSPTGFEGLWRVHLAGQVRIA